MRKLKYLSPTALALFRQNPDEYYFNYLCENRPPKMPQTQPMSIGSSFDAYIKSWLHEKLFGKGNDPKFDFETLFLAQVEPHNRDWAKHNGKIVFDEYVASGSLIDLVVELEGAIGTPKFETEVFGVVNGYREGVTLEIGGVPLLGKPDIHFINKAGARITHDWKVNGYCSSSGVSPMPGYVRLRERNKTPKSHGDCILGMHHGVMINIASYLEDMNGEWADQLSIYAWLCGEDVGSDFIASIDQVVCRPGSLRFAQHRLRVHKDYQFNVFANAQRVWQAVNSDWVFRELTREESIARCKLLDERAMGLRRSTGDDTEDLFKELTES